MRISDWSSDVCSSDLDDCQPFSRAPPVNRARRPYKSSMSNENDASMAGRRPGGLRHLLQQISQMANSPWGNGPKDGDDGGKGSGGDGQRPGPRNPRERKSVVEGKSGAVR